MRLNTSFSFFSALISWALAIFLGAELLSGTFDERVCLTTCVNVIFWISFTIAGIGLIFSIGSISVGKPSLTKTLSMLALFGLCGIYVVTMLVGTFGI